MEDISSVSRVAFGERKKHVPNATAESEGSNSTAFMADDDCSFES